MVHFKSAVDNAILLTVIGSWDRTGNPYYDWRGVISKESGQKPDFDATRIGENYELCKKDTDG